MKSSVTGADKLKKALQAIEGKVANKILRTVLKDGAKEVAAEIKELAPVGETGMLRRAIKVKAGKKKRGRISFQAQIGEGSFKGESYYGSFTDLGTEKQPAQHFIEKGFEKKAETLKDEIPAKIWAAIQAAAKAK